MSFETKYNYREAKEDELKCFECRCTGWRPWITTETCICYRPEGDKIVNSLYTCDNLVAKT